MLDAITPVVLTFNEAPNIGRTLARLAWARDIVVVDSGSTDDTLDIVRAHQGTRVFHRAFDTHAAQWTYALTQTGIDTPWALALDADYVLTEAGIEELSRLEPADDVVGYAARFTYCVGGTPLRGALYPAATVLFRRAAASFMQDGHTHRVQLTGRIGHLRNAVLHDDRKPLFRWVAAQQRYMRLEAEKLLGTPWRSLSWPDRLRSLRVVAPLAVPAYCLIRKGLILDGRAGLFYTLQRTFAELLLSLHLLDHDLRRGGDAGGHAP